MYKYLFWVLTDGNTSDKIKIDGNTSITLERRDSVDS